MRIASLAISLSFLAACANVQEPEAIHDRPLTEVTRLANSGNLEAVHDLCYRYVYGSNAPIDYEKAMHWCTRGASLGADSSQVLLAEIYLNGHGTPVNYQQAHYWYSAAAKTGHEHALLMLYYIYRDGLGLEANQEKADAYLQQAVSSGYQPAIEVQEAAAQSR